MEIKLLIFKLIILIIIKSVDYFGQYAILTILILSVQEHGISFHFFESSSTSFINALHFSAYRSLNSLVRFFPRYLFFGVILNRIGKPRFSFYLLIFGCAGAGSVLLCGLYASCPVSGGSSLVAVGRLLIAVASLAAEHGLQGTWASVVAARGLGSRSSWALEHRVSSCDTGAQLLCSMWDLPRPKIEPLSPALAGRVFTIEPPVFKRKCNKPRF